MRIPIQYVMALFLVLGGLMTAWIGPDAADEDGRTAELPPWKRRLTRWFGIALVVCGVILLVASLLGFRPPPGGDGPLF